jgi:hypothetical protein
MRVLQLDGTAEQDSARAHRFPTVVPEDARWNAKRQAVEFGVRSLSITGWPWVPRRVFQRLLPETPTPERCVEACYL